MQDEPQKDVFKSKGFFIRVKCHTNFDTYIKTIEWLSAGKGYN
jgi:hypothetical protein